MNGQNDLYHYLHNPDEYVKQKEYIKKKKLLYGNDLRLQIEENNRIKSQVANPTKKLKFPKITNNNKNSFYHQNYNDISKDNNDNNNYKEVNNNFNITNNQNNQNNQNFIKTLTNNFPNILNQKQINDNNNINEDINNDNLLNGNDLNIQKIFSNFVEEQINAIDDYISNVDKNINLNEENELENKNNDMNDMNNMNNMNETKKNNICYNRNNESINKMKIMIDKEKKKVIDNINLEKEKLKNRMGNFPPEESNKRIKELFNKIMNKKIIKYSSISPNNNKKNQNLKNNKNKNDLNSEKKLNNNNDNMHNNYDRENNNHNNFESNSNNIFDFSSNNNKNVKDKNIDSNNDNQNNFIENHTNINNKDNEDNKDNKNNNSNKGTLLKPSKNNFLNIESNNQKYDFAFNNNSFNNNSEVNKSFKSEEVNDDNFEEKSLSNSNSNQKEEENKDDDNEYNSNNEDKGKKSFILSKKDNIMDIFSRNEKNRIKKFSEVYKINDNKKYKEIKVRKNMSKKTFTFPVNQNFKNIKNISKDIKIKSFKTMKNNILAQKSVNFFRTRSKSYKGKKVNIKLKKKTDGNSNNQIDNIMADYYNRNNSKNLSYSYNDLNLKNKLNIEKKINISHNYDNNKRNKIPRKKKVSIQNEEISGMIGNTEPNTIFANRSNISNFNLDKRYNIFQKRSSSYAQNSKIYPLDKVEYRQSKTMNNVMRKRSGSSFITGMNIINNQFLPNVIIDRGGNDREDDRLYRMIKNFEESIKERIRMEEGKDLKQVQMHRTSNIYSNNSNMNSNMNINNILFRNNTKNYGEVELIPKKYIFRCKKIIYPEIESEKIKERERLLFGKK